MRQPLLQLSVLLGVAVSGLSACTEQLTTPVQCPALCPGGVPVSRDTTLFPALNSDSSYQGYVERGNGNGVLVSNGLPALNARGMMLFGSAPLTVTSGGAAVSYILDSLTINLNVLGRDSLVKGVSLQVWRLPVTIDTSTTFAAVDAPRAAGTLLATAAVPDTQQSGAFRVTITNAATLATLVPTAADSGRLAFGFGLTAPTPTGIRLSSGLGGTGVPSLSLYAHALATDSARSTLSVNATFTNYVTTGYPVGPANALAIGGAPSRRGLLRFTLPPFIRDSATIVRATLELLPAQPLLGNGADAGVLEVRQVVSDLGAKSPLDFTDGAALALLPSGSTDTLRLEVVRYANRWQSTTVPVRPTFFVQMNSEASTFTAPFLGSTRTPGREPRLRVTYLPRFPFEKP